MHAKFAKRLRKTTGRKMDIKCIFNLLLGGSFSPEKELQHEAHWNQWEDFQAFQWTLLNALGEQIAHVFRKNYVNNSGPWIWFMKAQLDQGWARKKRSLSKGHDKATQSSEQPWRSRDGLQQSGNSKSTALATAAMKEGVSASVQHHSQSPAPLLGLLAGTEPIQQNPHLGICFAWREVHEDKLEAVQSISKNWV